MQFQRLVIGWGDLCIVIHILGAETFKLHCLHGVATWYGMLTLTLSTPYRSWGSDHTPGPDLCSYRSVSVLHTVPEALCLEESAHLQSCKDFGACRGALEACVQKSCEGSGSILDLLHIEILSSGLFLALVCLAQAELGQNLFRAIISRPDHGNGMDSWWSEKW